MPKRRAGNGGTVARALARWLAVVAPASAWRDQHEVGRWWQAASALALRAMVLRASGTALRASAEELRDQLIDAGLAGVVAIESIDDDRLCTSRWPEDETTRLIATLPQIDGTARDDAIDLIERERETLLAVRPRMINGEVTVGSARGDRRARGAYYTPPELAREIARDALAKIKAPRAILDPACGAGRFLIEAARFVAGGAMLFGLDSDPLAIALTRSLLALTTTGSPAPSRELRARVRVGDAVNALADASTLRAAFECALPNGGVDGIIGNPPWGDIDPAARAHVREAYGLTTVNVNWATVFLVASLRAVRADGGVVGLLLPRNLARADDYECVRAGMLADDRLRVHALHITDRGQFPGVSLDALSMIAVRGASTLRVAINGAHTVDHRELSSRPGVTWPLTGSARDAAILARIANVHRRLPDLGQLTRGEELSRAARALRCPRCGLWQQASKREQVTCRHCRANIAVAEAETTSMLIDTNGTHHDAPRYLTGENINPFEVAFEINGARPPAIAGLPGLKLKFDSRRRAEADSRSILIRKIASRPVAALLSGDHACSQNVYRFAPNAGVSDAQLAVLTAVLNSTTVAFAVDRWWTMGATRTMALSLRNLRERLPVVDTLGRDERAREIVEALARGKDSEGSDLEWLDEQVARAFGLSASDYAVVRDAFDVATRAATVKERLPANRAPSLCTPGACV